MLIPFLWMISSSLKDVQELYAIPPYWIPKHVAWENYVYMFEQAPWFVYFGNTIFITVFTILGQLITCSMAAYAFARLNFKGKNILFVIYLGTMMIPFQAVMIPQFKIIKYMGLIDTKSSLVAVGIFNAFGTFLLRQFLLTIPKELEEAAKIDGCSYPRIFWEVILKNSKPALMTLIIFTFMNTWNDFLRPLIFINSEEKWTLAMGLAQFQGTYVSQWNQMMAGALISMLPILLVYIFAQKYFVQGIVMSGIKG
ncbi:carbohydrate ABC transporter permease [Blautia sp. AM22-22LB]|nr:carbohydrate ABC transporter permease [Blautia sp. AM22-22LB]